MKETNAIRIVMAVMLAALVMLAPAEAAEPAPRVHIVTASPFGTSTNAYLVETSQGVIAIDSAPRLSDAKALAVRIDSLGKPLLAVIITHGHPDHYAGVATLVAGRGEIPILATEQVAQDIAKNDADRAPLWKARYKDEWPDVRVLPNRTVRDGETIAIGGIRFTVRALGPGESNADWYWRIDADGGHAFIGDVVMANGHAYALDGHTAEWLRTLERLQRELAGVRHIHPGHGPSGGPELLRWEHDYIAAYRYEVDALSGGKNSLDEQAKKSLTENMKARYPGLPLEFLIGLGANAVARELAGESL